jgi:hypothetical protein
LLTRNQRIDRRVSGLKETNHACDHDGGRAGHDRVCRRQRTGAGQPLTGSGQECAYDSMAQREAAKRGSADTCVANSARRIIKRSFQPGAFTR